MPSGALSSQQAVGFHRTTLNNSVSCGHRAAWSRSQRRTIIRAVAGRRSRPMTAIRGLRGKSEHQRRPRQTGRASQPVIPGRGDRSPRPPRPRRRSRRQLSSHGERPRDDSITLPAYAAASESNPSPESLPVTNSPASSIPRNGVSAVKTASGCERRMSNTEP